MKTSPGTRHHSEEVFALRKKFVSKLGKKFFSLTKVLGRKPKYAGYFVNKKRLLALDAFGKKNMKHYETNTGM